MPASRLRLVWIAVVLLTAVGVVAALGRTIFVTDFATRIEPIRTRTLAALDLDDPFAGERPREVRRADARFADHPALTLLHVVPGGLFLLMAPLQFVRRIRRRHLRVHRWSGRALIIVGLASIGPGLYFGIARPFAGTRESLIIGAVGALFIVSLCLAFAAIRRRDIVRHREWMIRAYAMALAIATVRVFAAGLDVVLTPAGFPPAEIFLVSIASGWAVMFVAAELWIAATGAPARAAPGP